MLLLALAATTTLFTACDEETPNYEIPTTYDFENVDYSGQTQRLAQLTEMKAYLITAELEGATLDANKLHAMYANDAANAGFVGTYDDSKQLRNKTLAAVQPLFDALIDSVAAASLSANAVAAQGQAGVATSNNGTKKYLLNANGVEYTQFIEKGLMGACFYYQAATVYTGPDKMNADNETVTPGEGTAMEHHWDEAFGYAGIPTNFPTSTDGLAFWGKYSNVVNATLGTNQAWMDAFLKGRAAISNKDLATRDEAIVELRAVWEQIVAGTAIHYFNVAMNNENDWAVRAHALSEATAFVFGLQFNADKTMTNAQVDALIAMLGGSSDLTSLNFYNTTNADIQAAKDALAGYMGWDTATADAL